MIHYKKRGIFMKLPVLNFESEILSAVSKNQVTVIQAETGAGKSTQIPQMLYLNGYNKITITQPRIMATISLATRVAEELGENVGESIGYKTRYYKTEKFTPITYVTDGYELSTYSSDYHQDNEIVILDEIHEFNLNQETLLGLYKRDLKNNRNVRLVVMSATIDAEKISSFYDNAPIIKIPGKTYPIERKWEPTMRIEECVKKYFSSGTNMLVFLPGKEEIERTAENLSFYFKNTATKIFKLHGEMTYEEQKKVFAHYAEGKIILATNVAQTSITVPDIDFVIDDGNCKQMVCKNGVSSLTTINISQADCDQRAGRAGRCKPGKYVLCSPTSYEARDKYLAPEIERIGLENLVLKLADLHLDPMDLEFVHNPDKKNLQLAKLLLERLEALKDGQITEIGIEMEKMPVSARIARMLIEAKKYSPQVQGDMAIIGAILECGDFRGKNFYVPAMLTDECKKSDLTYQLLLVKTINNLWHTLEGSERVEFYVDRGIKKKIFQSILKSSKDIADKLHLQYMLNTETNDSDYVNIRNCIISAYCDSLYVYSGSYRGVKYEGADNVTRTLDRNSIITYNYYNIPKVVLAQPLDIKVSKGYYGPYTVNLLRNATAVDLDNEVIRKSLQSIMSHSYYYDEYDGILYDIYRVGSIVVKQEVSEKKPTIERYKDCGWTYRRVIVDNMVLTTIPEY